MWQLHCGYYADARACIEARKCISGIFALASQLNVNSVADSNEHDLHFLTFNHVHSLRVLRSFQLHCSKAFAALMLMLLMHFTAGDMNEYFRYIYGTHALNASLFFRLHRMLFIHKSLFYQRTSALRLESKTF